MRIRFSASLLALALLLAPTGAPTAQTRTAAESAAEQTAREYLARNASRHGLALADVAETAVTDVVTSARSGVRHVYLRQAIGGVRVVAGGMTVNVDRHGRVVLASGDFVAGLGLRASRASAGITPAQAAAALAADLGLVPTEPFRTAAVKTVGAAGVYLTDGGVSAEPVPAALVYDDDGTGRIVLAYEVGIAERGAPHYWLGTVDAATGRVVRRRDLVVHCTFSGDHPAAVAERSGTPHADHAHVHTPAAGLPAPAAPSAFAPFVGAAARHGSSVPAYRVYAAPVVSPLFATPLPPADARTLVVNPADVLASPLGWHATSSTQYTGARGNNVWAYVDATASNSPDPTGQPDGGPGLVFDFPLNLTQAPSTYREAAVTNLFYWNNLLHDVLYRYGFTEAAGNFQADNLGRGGPATDDAVRAEAQDGSGTLNANFYTPPDGGCGGNGCFPRMQMYLGTNASPAVDGDFDNHVVAHEYIHGLSIRKTGGPTTTTCLGNAEQMGEGWSDWYGLLFTMSPSDQGTDARGVGQYLFFPQRPTGIRPAPYSTSFGVNDWTYGHTRPTAGGGRGPAVPHGIGFVWSTALWEMTWELIGAHGFEPDLTLADSPAGNIVALNLVTEALRLQPCSPGFVSGRDAVLAADQVLYDGAHTELLWRAFARRGLGIGASQGSTGSNADNVESFVEPETIAPADVTDLAVVPDGDTVRLTFTATGDDGTVGTATTYFVRRASTPILTDADWAAATPVPVSAAPRPSGEAESLLVGGLLFETTYHFALRVGDESFNVSGLSNSAAGTTLAPPQAAVPTEPVAVTTETTATATVTLGNAGPSTLRWSLGLAGVAARQATPFDAGVPAPEAEKGAESAPEPAARRGQGGPDGFGYRWIDSNEPGGPAFAWTSIAATGTPLTLSDDATVQVPLGFSFPFYGTSYTSVFVSSNGLLSFGAGTTAFTNAAIPSPAAPNNFFAGYWDDLNPAAGGTVHHQRLPDGRFVVQFTNVPRFGGSTGTITFQMILVPGGAMVVQYLTVPSTNNSATIGLENPAGTDGLQVAFNTAYAQPNLAVRFSALWVEADVTAGTIPAGGQQNVVLTFSAEGLAQGLYEAVMTVVTNDPAALQTAVPLRLQVGQITSAEREPLAGAFRLSSASPNPSTAIARVTLAVAETQPVRADVLDALGRRVALVFDGTVVPGAEQALEVDVRGLAAGTYVLRVNGQTFSASRRLTVQR